MDDQEQRRDGRRYPVHFPVKLTTGKKSRRLFTEDVSFRGVFIRTESPPALRQLVRLDLNLPPKGLPLTVHGTVVHVVSPNGPAAGPPGVGVQLHALDRDARVTWNSFVSEVERAWPEPPGDWDLFDAPMSDPMRRRFERHPAVLKVSVAALDELYELFTRDVSKGGMFIETDLALADGTSMIVHVEHPESSDTFVIDAMVRHRQTTPGLCGVGVEFVGLTLERRNEFLDFVHDGLADDDGVVASEARPFSTLVR